MKFIDELLGLQSLRQEVKDLKVRVQKLEAEPEPVSRSTAKPKHDWNHWKDWFHALARIAELLGGGQ